MVFDFKNLNFIKKLIDEDLDHKFMMDINDPLFRNTFRELEDCKDAIVDKVFYKTIDPKKLPSDLSPEVKEKMEGLVMVDFVPTSENIAKMLFEIVENKLRDVVRVSFVELNETEKSHCRYTKD